MHSRAHTTLATGNPVRTRSSIVATSRAVATAILRVYRYRADVRVGTDATEVMTRVGCDDSVHAKRIRYASCSARIAASAAHTRRVVEAPACEARWCAQHDSNMRVRACEEPLVLECGGSNHPAKQVVRPARLERATSWFVARRSIQLSYGRGRQPRLRRPTRRYETQIISHRSPPLAAGLAASRPVNALDTRRRADVVALSCKTLVLRGSALLTTRGRSRSPIHWPISYNPPVDPVTAHRADAPASVRVFVLTISDTRTEATDTSGAAIVDAITAGGHIVTGRKVLRDDPAPVAEAVRGATVTADVIITTGGTGITSRDSTYEAISRLLEKRLDGFGELFRMLSYEQIGAAAMLSRACAGTIRRTVVFSLPGSEQAVRLAMTRLIVPELAHIVREIKR